MQAIVLSGEKAPNIVDMESTGIYNRYVVIKNEAESRSTTLIRHRK